MGADSRVPGGGPRSNRAANSGPVPASRSWEVRPCGGCSWVAVGVAALLLIAYLMDRRGRAGNGVTDRDRNEADRIVRGHDAQVEPWGGLGMGGSP